MGILIGGAICVLGQLLIDLTNFTPARVLVTYVVAGVILSALGFTTRWRNLPAPAPPCP